MKIETFDQYDQAVYNPGYPDAGRNFIFPALGLAGEAGEFAEKMKKLWRNHNLSGLSKVAGLRGYMIESIDPVKALEESRQIEELILGGRKELGDALWYLNSAARELGTTLQEIAQENYEKIADRRKRGVIKSEGDNR